MIERLVSGITEKQKRFVEEYLIDLNATQAAIRAGYSKKTARQIGEQNLSKLDIQEAIKQRMDKKEDELIAKQDEVLKTLTQILRRETKEVVVVTCKEKTSGTDENGKRYTAEKEEPICVEIPTRVSDVNKAAELLGKRYGLYADKIDLETDTELHIVVDYGDSNADSN